MSVIDSRVINIDELKLEHFSKGEQYQCDAVRIGHIAASGGPVAQLEEALGLFDQAGMIRLCQQELAR